MLGNKNIKKLLQECNLSEYENESVLQSNSGYLQFPFFTLFQVLIMAALTIGSQQQGPEPLNLVQFHPKGYLLLSGRAYYVVLRVDTTMILNQIKPISTALEDIGSNLANHLREDDQMGRAGRSNSSGIDKVLTTTLKDHLSFLSKDLLARQKALEDFLKALGEFDYDPDPPEKNVRAKRGLFDAGGEVLSYLFGTAMDSEVQNTEEILTRLEALSEEQREQINVHSTILNTTAIHLDAVETKVGRITTCLSAVRDNILQLGNHLRDNSRYEFTLAHSLVMSSALSYAATAMADLTSQILAIKAGINKFKSGYLSTDIIPPETILDLAEKITNLNLRPLFPATEAYLKAYYSYIRVWPLPHDSLSFVIEIPLVGDPAVKLKLYEVIAMPHPVSEHHVLAYSGLPKYLAISDDRSLYQERSSQDTCRTFENTIICPIDAPIYKDMDNSCIVSLFKRENNQNCRKHFSPASKTVTLEKTVLGWMYATSTHHELTITCAENVEMVQLKPGSGQLKTGDNCKVSSNQFILPSSAEARGSTIVKNMSLVYPFELKLNKDEMESLKVLNSTPLLKEIMLIANDKMPLTSLKSEIGNIKYIKKMRAINTVSAHTGLSLSIIALIIASVLLVGAIIVCKYANAENTNTEQATPDAVGGSIWRPRNRVKLTFNAQANRRRSFLDLYPLKIANESTTALVPEATTPIPPNSPQARRERQGSASTGRLTPAGTSPVPVEGEAFFPVVHPRMC